MEYADFVNYAKLDPFKRMAMGMFSGSLKNTGRLGIRVEPKALGEPAAVLDFIDYDFMLAFNVEGLGTKNRIADIMAKQDTARVMQFYPYLGIDTMAMSLNDLAAVGAEPFVYGDILSSGDSSWFADQNRASALLSGFKEGAEIANIAIPCGETPTLREVVNPETLDMAGASLGLIRPKSKLILGQRLKAGDTIFGIRSSGMHSNGYSLARKIAENLPEGYFTKLSGGESLGMLLLKPTTIYARPINELLDGSAEIHYIQPITGHGWQKIMRHRKAFDYVLDKVPEPQEEFTFLQEKGSIGDKEAYLTWNMGLGLCLYAPRKSEEAIRQVFEEKRGLEVLLLGRVEEPATAGEKRVIIIPKNIEYKESV